MKYKLIRFIIFYYPDIIQITLGLIAFGVFIWAICGKLGIIGF